LCAGGGGGETFHRGRHRRTSVRRSPRFLRSSLPPQRGASLSAAPRGVQVMRRGGAGRGGAG
jgi:hypothetical protein